MEQSFPTIRYHPTELSRVIATPDELDALDDAWRDTPYPAPGPAPASATSGVNPEVYRFVLRTAVGESTSDEQVLAPLVVAYLMRLSLGEATPEEEQQTAVLLNDFGIALRGPAR